MCIKTTIEEINKSLREKKFENIKSNYQRLRIERKVEVVEYLHNVYIITLPMFLENNKKLQSAKSEKIKELKETYSNFKLLEKDSLNETYYECSMWDGDSSSDFTLKIDFETDEIDSELKKRIYNDINIDEVKFDLNFSNEDRNFKVSFFNPIENKDCVFKLEFIDVKTSDTKIRKYLNKSNDFERLSYLDGLLSNKILKLID